MDLLRVRVILVDLQRTLNCTETALQITLLEEETDIERVLPLPRRFT